MNGNYSSNASAGGRRNGNNSGVNVQPFHGKTATELRYTDAAWIGTHEDRTEKQNEASTSRAWIGVTF
jgi:hypothetical protein